MTFRIETSDGTVLIVGEADLELVRAYLIFRGYPPVSVEVASSPPPNLDVTPCGL
jgi:hypothetical protein